MTDRPDLAAVTRDVLAVLAAQTAAERRLNAALLRGAETRRAVATATAAAAQANTDTVAAARSVHAAELRTDQALSRFGHAMRRT